MSKYGICFGSDWKDFSEQPIMQWGQKLCSSFFLSFKTISVFDFYAANLFKNEKLVEIFPWKSKYVNTNLKIILTQSIAVNSSY